MKKLIDYFDITSSGLFSSFLAPVWCYAFPDSSELDLYFITNYGDRNAFETLLDKFADDTGKITGTELSKLADMVYHINARKWENLFKIYNAEYSPIENTDVYESFTEKTTTSGEVVTDSDSSYKPDSSTTYKKAGFNSSTMQNESSSSTSGTDVTELDQSVTSEAEQNHTSEHRKHGNIGVMDNATMMQKSSDFWEKWSFMDLICCDICKIIALSIY